MNRLSLVLTVSILSAMCSVVSVAQETGVAGGVGTIRGIIEDTSTAQAPIAGVAVVIKDISGNEFKTITDDAGQYAIANLPAGRYFVSIYKDGYGDREGKPVNVIAGGDRYFSLKMTKQDNVVTFFQQMGFVFWPLMLFSIVALAYILKGVTRVLSK